MILHGWSAHEDSSSFCLWQEMGKKSDEESDPRSPSDAYSSDDDKVLEHLLVPSGCHLELWYFIT